MDKNSGAEVEAAPKTGKFVRKVRFLPPDGRTERRQEL